MTPPPDPVAALAEEAPPMTSTPRRRRSRGPYAIHICGMDLAVKDEQATGCPQWRHHTKGQPEGYIEWHDWAERKSRTHEAERCPGCGLFTIWRPKVAQHAPEVTR